MLSWLDALNKYSYPVNLCDYEKAHLYPNHFKKLIIGDRESTIDFENYFRKNAHKSIEVYFEVIFWKLYSQEKIRQRRTTEMILRILRQKTKPQKLYDAIKSFTINPSLSRLKNIRKLLGIKTNVLAVPLTFPAFLNPEKYPMVDNVVARWVNENFIKHNSNRQAKLTPFVSPKKGFTSLRDIDFQSYLNWVGWCNETAYILTQRTSMKWRARDVEMAVFTAKRRNLKLNVLF